MTPSSQLLHPLESCPDLFDLVELNPHRYPYLLENSGATSDIGHFDILFSHPGMKLVLSAEGELLSNSTCLGKASFLQELDLIYKQHAMHKQAALLHDLPFCGGWFLYLGYELVAEVEPVLESSIHESDFPRATMTEIPAGIIRDKKTGLYFIFASGEKAEKMLSDILFDINFLLKKEAVKDTSIESLNVEIEEDEDVHYLSSVDKIKSYIRDGDVFQVNLSRLWSVACNHEFSPFKVWRKLRIANPSPFAAWARINDDITLLSSSPERLIEHRQGEVKTRPIAGTYPRDEDNAIDNANSAELLLHPKERAEHIMLVDLERNDLGRICRPGTIKVDELMVLESYAHVHHIVSSVTGEVAQGTSPANIIRAVFPGGTITGCPKVRCMEIIAELEQQARNAYTGSLGYLCYNGDMDLNILIRTLTHSENSYSFRAGAGIVADSDPLKELQETRSKAKGMIKIFE